RETGHGSRKIFINSENPRGRRPVACRIAGKDPINDNNYHLYKYHHTSHVHHKTTTNNQFCPSHALIDLCQLNVKTS
ncbi:hypothetical protein F0269_25275, partial [Escherichia coli]|nr:hypothetical protein [Escherichia coli]EFE8273172.1 hypothetical protein [Escherichia coli]EFN6002584.1 hypothetical protein [Escherichia coli]